jgi:uncharacterized protein (TIGR00251 family)
MIDPTLQVRETALGLEVRIHVSPRAKRCEISGVHNGALKVKVIAPPVDDAANRAIIEFFASLLNVPKSSLRIPAGSKSRDKILQIKGLSYSSFINCLNSLGC